MIVQGDAQQDVEMAECVSGRVCAGVCGCVCEWVGEIVELREYVTKMNELYGEVGELVCVCAGGRVRARLIVHTRACVGLEEDEG